MDVSKFCDPSDIRQILTRPFALDGRTVASDGRILVSVPLIDGTEEAESASEQYLPRFRELIDLAVNAPCFAPIPPYEAPAKSDMVCPRCMGDKTEHRCKECDGEGEVVLESDYNLYEVECKSCGGDGVVSATSRRAGEEAQPCVRCGGTGEDKTVPVKLGSIALSFKYLEMIAALPGVEIDISSSPKGMVPFRFDGGFGAVMPMNY